ncbi:hypothetical protein [Caulobacter soli]|uniref:hypothetical protein n=1 Tax=Caulobacter soli TaxID=2708539 RepID=UPI0013ED60C2|nr:hypothetical protein [Caulobacter soli]
MFLGAMFPGGLIGVALLIGRLAAAAVLMFVLNDTARQALWLALPLVVVAAGLVAGLLTRFAAAACVALVVFGAARADGALCVVLALNALQVVGIVLAGAGAYSLDARLFGRRVIRLDD